MKIVILDFLYTAQHWLTVAEQRTWNLKRRNYIHIPSCYAICLHLLALAPCIKWCTHPCKHIYEKCERKTYITKGYENICFRFVVKNGPRPLRTSTENWAMHRRKEKRRTQSSSIFILYFAEWFVCRNSTNRIAPKCVLTKSIRTLADARVNATQRDRIRRWDDDDAINGAHKTKKSWIVLPLVNQKQNALSVSGWKEKQFKLKPVIRYYWMFSRKGTTERAERAERERE